MTQDIQTRSVLRTDTFEQLADAILKVDDALQTAATKAINQTQTIRNWIVGGYIVEYEQNGKDRANYGDMLLRKLATRLNKTGLGLTMLKYSRSFYLLYPQVNEAIVKGQTSDLFANLPQKSQTSDLLPIDRSVLADSHAAQTDFFTPAEKLITRLSFSHIVELIKIDDPLVRFFYETECIKGTWSVRELRRQIATQLHIRVGLSADKIQALKLANESAEHQTAAMQIREPYTFEFLGLKPTDVFTEEDLKTALVLHLQDFLLEMGKGFCFEAREKRIIIDDEYYFADLVFYNRVLHCNVIIEVKVDEFRHEHIGQLNAYVSYFAENEMNPGDNPPIGILLCTKKGKKMVEYALGNLDQQLFVSTYQLQLPNPQELENLINQELSKEGNV